MNDSVFRVFPGFPAAVIALGLGLFLGDLPKAQAANVYVSFASGSPAVNGVIQDYDGTTGATGSYPSPSGLTNWPANLALSGNNLYVSDVSHDSIEAFDATTGLPLAGFTAPRYAVEYMAVWDNALFADGGSAGPITNFNAYTGASHIFSQSAVADPLAMATNGSTLYVGDGTTGSVFALSTATGQPIAGFTRPAVSGAEGMAVSGNILYVCNSASVTAYDATSGAPLAGFTPVSVPNASTIAASGGELYVLAGTGGLPGTLEAYDGTTGANIPTFAPQRYNSLGGGLAVSAPVPEPGSVGLLVAGLGGLLGWRARRNRPA